MCKNLPGKENRNYLRNHIFQVFNLRLQTIAPFTFYFFFALSGNKPYQHLAIITFSSMLLGLPGGSDGKESARSKGDLGLIPGFMPGEFHGQRSQAGYSP